MHFKKQEVKYLYQHLKKDLFDNDIILIGVTKDMLGMVDEVLLAKCPAECYDKEIFPHIFQLQGRDRGIVIKTMQKWKEKQKKEDRFKGLYWDCVLDFILYRYGKTSMDIAKELEKLPYFEENFREDTSRHLYDRMEKMRINKSGTNQQGRLIFQIVCSMYGITEEILKKGEGTVYDVDYEKGYTMERVAEYINTHEDFDLKKMIADITGVEENEIKGCSMTVATRIKRLPPDIYDFLEILIDEMKKSRE